MIHPPGMIGLPCAEQARWSDFLPSILGLQKPGGTVFKKSAGLGVANPLNDIGREFIARPHLEWLFLTNDDNLYPKDALLQLLDRDVDVVTGLYLGKLQPFEPVVFVGQEEEPDALGKRWYRRLLLRRQSGLIPIVACGDGCLLIRRRVMEAIPDPWWAYGEIVSDACDHDMVFCRRVREAGFDVWCDLDVKVDHITGMTIRPVRQSDGVWATHLIQGEGRKLLVPAAEEQAAFDKENE